MIHLDYRDSKPIYEQVKEGYRKLILQGVLQKDEKMPSVRETATSLTINPNTIQRAYRELEQEGFIYSVPGKGSFVAEQTKLSPGQREEKLKDFDRYVEELVLIGITKEDLIYRLENKGGAKV
ncbi:MAG: GntR family transcriptional regulator [Lachnospiraceae bacterium]